MNQVKLLLFTDVFKSSMVATVYLIQDCIYFILFILITVLETYYLIVISSQLVRKLSDYRRFAKLSRYELHRIDKYKQLYNFKTVIINYVLVIGILSLELMGIVYMYSSITLVNYTTQHSEVRKIVEKLSPNCSVHSSNGYYYYYPAARLIPISIIIQNCSLLTLISFLTTFLKKRYYVHPIRNSLIRYIAWWCIQVVMLLSCCIVYLFPLLFIVCLCLLLINWFHLIRESRQLAYILKARISDIVNYEWDPVHYKQSRSAYRLSGADLENSGGGVWPIPKRQNVDSFFNYSRENKLILG